jgi:SSS family solute:Na+ symporter
VPTSKKVLPHSRELAFSTLALGSGLAQYLYPHSLTGALSSTSERVVRHNAASLPVYTIMAGLLSLLGYVAIAAGFHPTGRFGNNAAVPHLFHTMFPAPFAGYALAAIAIGALIPASVMSIASGSLLARNVYRDLLLTRRQGAGGTAAQTRSSIGRLRLPNETNVAKYGALGMKLMGVLFILLVPSTFIINFQLAGGVWILQTLPTVFLGLFVTWMDWRALLAGWAVGLTWGTVLLVDEHFSSLTTLDVGSLHTELFIGIPAVLANLVVSLALTGALRGLGRSSVRRLVGAVGARRE